MMTPTTLKAHGGSVRYWHRVRPPGESPLLPARVALCRDGAILAMGPRNRWYATTLTVEMMEKDKDWETDTRTALSAAVTRTGRDARRTQEPVE